jgi:hypothetical protein
MKKMNVIPLFVSLFMLFSCNQQEQFIQDQIVTTKVSEEQKNEYLYGLQIYYSSAVAEINGLEQRKAELLMAVEKGKEEALKELEKVQEEIEKLNQFKEYLLGLSPPVGPDRPIPMPPIGCMVTSNCDPKQDITYTKGIVLVKEIEVLNVEVRNDKNRLVGEGTETGKDEFGQQALLLKLNFTGSATMTTTLNTEVVGKITLVTPVVFSK